jgi:Arc/MetJ-type ribon-helix-helix transcriptional regulator
MEGMITQIVTVNPPSIYIDAIRKLCEQGLFPSRSEAIRVALRDFLKTELGMVESLLDLEENEGKVAVVQAVKAPAMKKIDMRSIRNGWT